MYTELDRKLKEAEQGFFRLHKIDSMLQRLREEEQILNQKALELDAVLAKENLDLAKLEKRSLAFVFHSILGNLEKKVEKERSEALLAKFKYDQTVSDLEDVEREISRLSQERSQCLDWERKYRSLYAEKKEFLLQSQSETAELLMAAEDKLHMAKNNVKEINEAIVAGNAVIASVDSTLNSLNSAGNWGTWDILGGGLLADLAKHSHIDEAKVKAQRTQVLLRRFNTELADVEIRGDFTFETGGFAKFADFFFDGLFADLFMQSKIRTSQDNMARVRSQVSAVLKNLGDLEEREAALIQDLEREIDNLVTRR